MDRRQIINQLAEKIYPQLKPLPYRKQRNPYAHIYGIFKQLCSCGYKEVDQNSFDLIIKAIEHLPNGSILELQNKIVELK